MESIDDIVVRSLNAVRERCAERGIPTKSIQRVKTRFRENPVPQQLLEDFKDLMESDPMLARQCRQEIADSAHTAGVFNEVILKFAGLWPETTPKELFQMFYERRCREQYWRFLR